MTFSSILEMSVGFVLLGAVFTDLVWTTLGVSYGAGPLTSMVLRVGWWAAAPLRRRRAHGAVAVAGTVTVLSTLAVWVVMLWAAWASVFLAAGDGIIGRAGSGAGAWDRIYFAGYSVFTLGNGEFQPDGALWQVATVSASLSGLTVVSLAIAYLVLVTSAAAERHATAVTLSLLGPTPIDIVRRCWSGRDDDQLKAVLMGSAPDIVELTHRHLAYPVLHFFHTQHSRASPPVAIAVLDDAVTLLMCGVAPEARPSPHVLEMLRGAIDDYIEMVGHHYTDLTSEPPAPLTLEPLVAAGIPTVQAERFDHEISAQAIRRHVLYELVAAEGFDVGTAAQHRDAARHRDPNVARSGRYD